MNSGPLSVRMTFGQCRAASKIRSRTRVRRCAADRPCSVSMATASCVASSTIVRLLSARPAACDRTRNPSTRPRWLPGRTAAAVRLTGIFLRRRRRTMQLLVAIEPLDALVVDAVRRPAGASGRSSARRSAGVAAPARRSAAPQLAVVIRPRSRSAARWRSCPRSPGPALR